MKIFPHFLLSCISFFFIFLILEIAIKYTHPLKLNDLGWQSRSIYKLDSRLIYSLKSNQYEEWIEGELKQKAHTNNLSLRGMKDTSLNKTNNNYRIIMVGDSFTFGLGLSDEESYPGIMDSLFSKIKPNKFEVLNAGIAGYSPDQQYRQIMEQLILLKPDLIIWNINKYDINDSLEAVPPLYALDDKDTLRPLDARFNWLYINNRLSLYTPNFIKKTYLFHFLTDKIKQINFLRRTPDLPEKQLLKWAQKKLLLQIKSIGKIANEHNFNLLIVILPTKDDNSIHASIAKNFFVDLERYLDNNGIKYIDISENFNIISNMPLDRPRNNDVLGSLGVSYEKIFFKDDIHLNSLGTQLVAKTIYEFLMTQYIDKL